MEESTDLLGPPQPQAVQKGGRERGGDAGMRRGGRTWRGARGGEGKGGEGKEGGSEQVGRGGQEV